MKRLVISAIAVAALAGGAAAQSSEVADFYRGKTVTVVAPVSTGGSIYQYALLVSNHIGRHIPGNPAVVVEDRPGGGGVRAASYIANAAPDDGLVIAELHPSSLIVPLTRDVNYDFADVHWLGSVAIRPYVGVVWEDVEADTIEAMRETDTPVIFGSSGVGGSSYQYPVFVAHVTGAKIEVIPGYESGGEMNIAMERGEVHGRGNYYEGFLATNPDWIEEGRVKFVFRMGDDHPDLMDVPRVADYTDTDSERQMLGLLEAPLKLGQAFYVHPNVPRERVEALRTAFNEMVADEEFLAEADKLNLVIRPKSAEDLKAVVDEVYETPKEVAAELDELFRQ